MYRLFLVTISILYSSFVLAKGSYQIDLILFAPLQNANKNILQNLSMPLIPISKNAIPLQNNSKTPYKVYHLLPLSQSKLGNEYYLLSHKPLYHVLGSYSWRQTPNNQHTVALPNINHNGWEVQGTLRIQQSNYYLFNADLQVSPPNNPQNAFTLIQKQRLKANLVHYLDHPQVGMLVKIHKVA